MHKTGGWQRERVCVSCGKVEFIRKDSKAIRCRSCSARLSQAASAAARVANRPARFCECCGNALVKEARFCSVKCFSAGLRINRKCECCGLPFSVPKSVLSGKTNSSGRFCSRPCYEKFMCKEGRVTGRGSRWNSIRKEVLAEACFCAFCGDTKNLDVHHIVPFRISNDNSKENLIPLCKAHHKSVECMTNDIIATGLPKEMILVCVGGLLRTQQYAIGNWLIKTGKIENYATVISKTY